MEDELKRIGFIYSKVYDKDNIRKAIKNAQKGKQFYQEVKEINKNPEKYVNLLHDMIKNKTYKTSEYEVFIKNDKGKEREIYKLPFFPDRVCHWAIIQVVEPYFINKLNHCTHSAIPKRGIHSAFKQMDSYMRNDIEGTKYCLKLDVKKYYPSIPHKELKDVYRRIFKDPDLLWLIDEIIESGGSNVGVPIGNYLSQYSGNLYLYQFDRWIKEELKIKYYIRYMDDIVILHKDKKYLHNLKFKINHYLHDNLKLTIKENWQIFPSRVRGIDFVGYRHFGDYVLLRRSIATALKRKMRKIQKKVDKGIPINYSDWCSINSYKGWLLWCNGYNLYCKYIKPLEPIANDYYERDFMRRAVDEVLGLKF